MMTHAKPVDPSATMAGSLGASSTTAGTGVDVSPEAIAALVAQGASVLGHVSDQPEASPDALPLLVGITHDLRSPLSSMLVLIEHLRAGHAGPLTPLQENQLGLLYSATFGVASLVNDVLDVARGAAREALSPAPVTFSVADVWKSVRVLVQPIAEEKRLLLRWSGPRQDFRVGHPSVLHRVLLNLVTNALKFTDSGSVTVSASDVGNDRVLFQVRDTGHGMPATVKAQLSAVHPSRKGALPSSGGLGIALCQQMLAPLNSALEFVEQRDAPGTCLAFTVELTAAG
jgi:signal transduction histidine kinase